MVSLSASEAPARLVSGQARLDAVRRAVLSRPVDVEKMDLLNGPEGDGARPAGAEVACRYEERDPKRPIGGHSRKFPCREASGARLKVKYGADNTEVYGEVAGTRLFWALGFFAERMYPVKIKCENCPVDPFTSDKTPRASRLFDPATIQWKLRGEELSETADEGWTFDELDLAPDRAEADALKLLAVLVNHGDNTANQQRLLCEPADKGCKRPLMYVTDLGGTFGGKGYYTNYKAWARKPGVWKDKAACVADFRGETDSFRDPAISEAGRAFLAERLARLSEKQVRDLFTGARMDRMPGGASIDQWTRAFMKKREEILSARCPE